MEQLKEGMKAPFFEGIDQHGKVVKLSDFANRFIILYFLPIVSQWCKWENSTKFMQVTT